MKTEAPSRPIGNAIWMAAGLTVVAAIVVVACISGYAALAINTVLTTAVVLGMAYYWRADYQTKIRLQHRAAGLLNMHGGSLMKGAVALAVLVYSIAHRKTPTEPEALLVLKALDILGLLVTMGFVAWNGMMVAVSARPYSLLPFIVRVMSLVASLYFAMWAIGEIGDDALASWRGHPTESAALAVACAILWVILRAASNSPSPGLVARAAAPSGTLARRAPAATERDLRSAAAHEAGHALVYAALGHLPQNVRAVVGQEDSGALGFVTGVGSPFLLRPRVFAEWSMLVSLAGKAAEIWVTGEETLGSGEDHEKWLDVARSYLENHSRGVYYCNPKDRLELQQNEEKLSALQIEQLSLLRDLFSQNDKILRGLADKLFLQRELNRGELLQHLLEVQLPSGFPRPFGKLDPIATQFPGTPSGREA